MIGVFLVYKLLAIAVVPLALAMATFWFSVRQENAARAIATHDKLLASYMEFASTHSRFRHASSSIALLAARHVDVPLAELRDAVIELDNAFDAESAKLTPFEDVENALASKPPRSLNDLWTYCFRNAYFDAEPAIWMHVQSDFAMCGKDTCGTDVAKDLNTTLANIEQPKCASAHQGLQTYKGNTVNMGTIWHEISRIMTLQCALNNLECKLPGTSENN